MSRIYDNWERLVGAVLRREKDRQLALFQSFSSSSSAGVSSRFSFDYAFDADFVSCLSFDPVPGDVHVDFTSHLSSDPFPGDIHVSAVYRSLSPKFNPADPSSQNTYFFRNVMAIEYEEIKKTTRYFDPSVILGVGSSSYVYKGWVHEHHLTAVEPGSGMIVAVKKLRKERDEQHNQWVDEIHYLSQLRHPNLVRLIGYSFDKDNRIMVYEYMRKGSLENHLFAKSEALVLPWATRIKVALGAARAVAFLHNLETPVVHRNITCPNILLDGDFQTKLSGFGLATDGPSGDMAHVEAPVFGTYGYAAPEYVATGHLTTSCDVYGFGIVLLELISGLRAIDRNRPKGKHNLIDWGKPYFRDRNRLARFMDSKLEGQYPPKEAYKLAQIALKCASSLPRLRPTMTEVVAELEKL